MKPSWNCHLPTIDGLWQNLLIEHFLAKTSLSSLSRLSQLQPLFFLPSFYEFADTKQILDLGWFYEKVEAGVEPRTFRSKANSDKKRSLKKTFRELPQSPAWPELSFFRLDQFCFWKWVARIGWEAAQYQSQTKCFNESNINVKLIDSDDECPEIFIINLSDPFRGSFYCPRLI